MSRKSMKKIIKIRLTDIAIIVAIIALIAGLIGIINSKRGSKEKFEISPEIIRSREYDLVKPGDEVTNSDYVLFDAFFLKDLDGDGKADSIRGTCNEIGKEDTLYLDLKVLNNGYFKNGKITINSSNFYFNTTIVKDSIIKENYISNNTKTINLKEITNGSQKLITGMVRSGDYSNAYYQAQAIGSDTNKYSQINSITLTGTHVDNDGTQTQISKTVNFNVDWYGTTKAGISVTNIKNEVDDMEQLINGQNLNLEFEIKTEEKNNKLILSSSTIEGTIPELNGYKPISAEFIGEGITSTYNSETGAFSVRREAVTNDEGIVTKIVNTSAQNEKRFNSIKVKLVYPKEAYDNMEDNSIDLFIPVRTWYEGYNNPNNPFDNPYVSNIAEATISARWLKYSGNVFRYDIYVGKYMTNPYVRYVVSKEKPLKIYNNISEEENNDYYTVRWQLTTGRNGISSTTTMKETKQGQAQVSDVFIKKDTSQESMEDITTNVGIYFTGADSMLGQEGWIKVYNDETNELIATFTEENWNTYKESNPYYYQNPVKHIRVETSSTNPNAIFNAYSIKELDDKYITENYEREEFDSLKYVKSSLTGTFNEATATVAHSAVYEAPLSVAKIRISQQTVSTQETTQNQIITITADASQYNEQKWKDGAFLVKIPKEIIDMEINSVTVDKSNVSILGYDLYEEDDTYYIKILTENETEEQYNIKVDCNMTPDPRNATVTRKLELYAINGQGVDYYFKGTDTYDIDGDSNTTETLNYVITNINIVSPNELLTNQLALKYDDENNQTIAPRVAKVEKSQRTAEINVNLINNYAQNITDVVIQGVIPFEGNKFIIGDRELGSTFSSYITNAGIIVPEELQPYVTVYYSTEEKPSNNLTDPNNKWKTANQITDWNEIKTYAIDLGDYVLSKEEKHTFKYTINIPEGVNYNDVSYSEHAIYFSLLTDAGKYSTYTASDKLGFMIAKQYDLEIEKTQKNTNKKLPGITFTITEEGQEDSKIKVTDTNGKLELYGLFAERTYIIKEIKTTDDYVLNGEEIKFYTYDDEYGNLHVAYKNDNNSYTNLQEKYNWLKSATVTKNNGEEYKINIQLENEPKAKLKITKKNGTNLLSGVKFKLTGRDKNNSILVTNRNGEINTSGLYLNEEYTLQEIKATGYYLLNNPITFKLSSSENLQVSGDGITSNSVTTTDEIPTINLQLENEKIPEYSLRVVKKEKDTETLLEGTQFILTGEDKNSNIIYTTDENGTLQIDNLYEYVEGKNVEAKYTLQEFYPSEGYVLNETPLVFKAKRNNNDELELQIESGNIRGEAELNNTDPTNPIITVTLDNEPIFTLTKVDEDTNEPLPGVEFKITDLSDNPVTDINGNDLSKVITDENGKIKLGLSQGLYKATEIKQLPGYQEPDLYTGIGIGESKEATKETKLDRVNDELSYNQYVDITTVEDGIVAITKSGVVTKYDLDGNLIWENKEKAYGYNGVASVERGIIAVGNDGKVIKYDLDGNIVWENTEKNYRYYGVTTVEAGIIAVAYGGQIVKYDLNGNVVWENTEKNYLYYGVTTVEDGIIAVAYGGQVVKYDLNGNVVWENIEKNYRYYGVTTVEAGIITVAYSGQVVKYDLNGNVIWENKEKTYNYNGVTIVENGVIAVASKGKVVKYDLNGNVIWENKEKTYSYNGIVSVENGIITTGNDGHVVKYDLNGNAIWENSQKGCYYHNITIVEDEVIAIGNFGQVVKYDLNGNVIWENSEKNYNYFGLTAVENGVIVTANSGQVIKYDLDGNIIWENNEKKYNYREITTVEDGVIAADGSGKITKYDLDGNIVWENAEKNYNYYGITTVENGVIAVAFNGQVVKYDLNGNVIWENKEKTYLYIGVVTLENGVIAVGSNGNIVKYDLDGNVVWENVEKNYSYYGATIVEDGIIVVGFGGQIVKYDFDGNIAWENKELKISSGVDGIASTDNKIFVSTQTNGIAIYSDKITDPEIPASQNVIVKNKKQQFKITTEVKGNGGSISGQEEKPYEEVKYMEDSIKEIKATPDPGYTITKITVNGKEIEFYEEIDGSVLLNKFTEMTEDKHVVVEFSNTVSKIEVNHYLWKNTTGPTTTKLADGSTQTGNVDDEYSTLPKFDLEYEIITNKDYYGDKTEEQIIAQINTEYGTTFASLSDLGYEDITDTSDENFGKTPLEQFREDFYIPQNSRGQFKVENQVINYYYKEKTYTLTVKHLLEGTEQNMPSKTGGTVEDEVTYGYKKYVDDATTPESRYTTTVSDQIDYEKYELVAEPDNKNGTIVEDTEVRYYYKQKEYKITTKVQEHEETSSLGETTTVKGGSITGENESPYETVKHGEDATKEIKAVPDENYLVKSITVNGEPVDFTPENDGSVILSKFTNVTEDKEVIVEFVKKQGTVIVHHYIEGTTNPIDLNNGTKAQDETSSGNVGDIYATKPNENAAIKYVVVNDKPERSSGTYIDGTIEVTYYYKERRIAVTVNKVWNDNNNNLGIRPNQVTVNLKAYILNELSQEVEVTDSVIPNGVAKQVTLNNGTGADNGNNWTYTWQTLDQYTTDSKQIIYKVEEEELTGNLGVVYSSEVTRDDSNLYNLTITNKYNKPTEKINYVVDKVWDDNSDENQKRPEKLVFNIYKVGANNSKTQVKTYTINTNSESSHTFELDRYDEKGNEINYIAEEQEKENRDLYFYTQTGGQKQEITLNDKKAYKSEFTNKFNVPDEKVDIEVTKEWNDNSNENQKRPERIKLVLYKVQTTGTGDQATSSNVKVTDYTLNTTEEKDSFIYTFENQPKYDKYGNEIVYIVDEEEINEDDLKFYTKAIQKTEGNKYKITNTFTVPEDKIEIEAEKVWSEENDTQKQRRPSSVMLKLMNGTIEVNSDVANTDNNWKVTFTDLAKYDSRGREIAYKLTEEEVNEDDLKFYTKTGSSNLTKVDDTHYKLTYTNTFNVPDDKIDLTVTKVWNDEDGKDRINSVKLILTGNGQSYNHTLTESNVDSTNSNNWVYTFKNLPKYNSNGEEITYSLSEEGVNNGDLDKYISKVNKYTAENKLIIKETKIEKTGTPVITSTDETVNYTIKYEAKIAKDYTGKVQVKLTDTLPYEIDLSKENNLNNGVYNANNKTIIWEEEVNPVDGKIEITKNIAVVYKNMPSNIDSFTNKVKGKLELENGVSEEKQAEKTTIKEKTYTLTVKHLLEGTETSMPSKTGGIVEDEITKGLRKYVDDATTPESRYTTTVSDQIDYEKYELVAEPDNKNGTIVEDTEVRYYYKQKEYKITTKVQEHEETSSLGETTTVKGGSITGENESPYETVKHGEDATKEIKAVPDENYLVKSITVNGEPVDFTPENDGSVILSKFTNVTEDKEVIVEFVKKQGTVIVHHYIEGTTNPIDLNNGTKAQDETSSGNVGDIYATKPNENAAIKYVVVNDKPERSSGTYIDGTIEVTYYYKERRIAVTVNKVWNDNNNNLGIRPNQVTVNLKAYILNELSQEVEVTDSVIPNGVAKQVTLNNGTGADNGNNWTYTWQTLDQYTTDSKQIIYKVEEEELTGNLGVVYSSEVTRDDSNLYNLTITNKYNKPTEKINYVVDKVWDDNSDENQKRPEKLVFNIYKVGANNSKTQVKTYTINTNSESSHTFELDRYDEKGNEINYIAEEQEKENRDLYFYTQTGGQKQEITLNDKKAYKSEFTNKFNVPDEKVDIEVTKEWNDNSNENQKRPERIKLVLYKVQTTGTGDQATSSNVKVTDYTLNTTEEKDSFIYTFENQPKYDKYGNEIVYIVDEEEINEDDLKFYTKAIQKTEGNKYKITNTFTVPEDKIEIEAEKVWSEENDTQKQRRPSSVMLKLMNGTIEVNSDVANTDNNWKVTFTDLAKYDSRGREIAYKLTEEEVNEDDLKFYTKTGSSNLTKVDDTHYKLTYTNTFNVPDDKIDLTVTKVWNDEDGKDRINSVKLILTGNGQSYNHTLTESNVDSTNSNNWVYTFKNLPKYNSNGEEITYSLSEEGVNNGDLDKYISKVNKYTAENKLIIKETKIEKTGTPVITSTDETVNYTIKYEAKIAKDYTGKVQVKLTDTLPYEIDLSKENNLNNGVYNANNKTIIWEEEVNPVDGKIEITKNISVVYKDMPVNIENFTNKVKGKLELENGVSEEKQAEAETEVYFKRNIFVTKEWKGDTNSDIRPEEIEIKLLQNGNEIDTKILKASDNWKSSFEGLDKYDKETKEEIKYTVEENVPKGYYVEITSENVTGANNLGFRVTNNKYGKITIIKEDKLNHIKKIGGAEFTLTKLKEENGKWVEDKEFTPLKQTTSTDEKTLGIAEFDNLKYGKYRIEETKAPEGYEKLKKTVDIEINESNPEVQTSIKNKEITALPATGAVARGAMVMLGFAMITMAIRMKKSKRIIRTKGKHSK